MGLRLLRRVTLGKPGLAAISLALGLALSLAAVVAGARHSATTAPAGTSLNNPFGANLVPANTVTSIGPCTGPGGAVAQVGQLSGGAVSPSITWVPAIDNWDASFVVMKYTAAPSADAGGFLVTGTLESRSQDPIYSTCDYKAADSPGALRMVNLAKAYFEGRNVLSAADVDAPSTIDMVSDDPSNANRLIVSLLLESPINFASPAPVANSITPYAVVIDKLTGQVLGGGRAHWYDFDTGSPLATPVQPPTVATPCPTCGP